MNKKMKRALVTMMTSSLVAIPIGFTTAFTTTSINSNKFIFAGRFFHNKQEALAYMLHHNMLNINEQKVVGDTSHAFANVEKGLINKYVLPDYTPSHMQFAWFNKGGGITRDYEAAKNSYYSLGDSSVRYFDGFGGSFPNQSSAQRSMRQWITTGASGYYEVPFFQGEPKTHINPLNAKDVEAWKNNLQTNVDKLIKDNLIIGAQNPSNYQIVFNTDSSFKNDYNFIEKLKNASVINYSKPQENFLFSNWPVSTYYTVSSKQNNGSLEYHEQRSESSAEAAPKFNWGAETFHFGWGRGWDFENGDWWFGNDDANQKIHYWASTFFERYGKDNSFKFYNGTNYKYKFSLNEFNNLLNMNVAHTNNFHKHADSGKKEPSIVSSLKSEIMKPLKKEVDDTLQAISPDLGNNGESNSITSILENKLGGLIQGTEEITFKASDMRIDHMDYDRSSDHHPTSDLNYATLSSVEGHINIDHSIKVNGFYNNWNNYIDQTLSSKNTLINDLVYLKNHPGNKLPIIIKYKNGVTLFKGELLSKSDGHNSHYEIPNLQVPEQNHDLINADAEGKESLTNIDSLINDLKNKQDNQTYREVLEAWDRRCQVSGVDFMLGNSEEPINLIQNLQLLIYSLKNLINKYKNSEGLLHTLSEEIGKINVKNFVFIEQHKSDTKLTKSVYTINSIASVNGSMLSWNTPIVSSEFQKDYDRLYNAIPAAVEVLYKPSGEQYICDDWMFDTEEVMKYNFLRDINVRRDDSHIYIDGYNEPFSNVVTSIYHLSLNGENIYFDTFNHLRDYVYQYIGANSTEVRD